MGALRSVLRAPTAMTPSQRFWSTKRNVAASDALTNEGPNAAIDPAAVVDIDATGASLRIAATTELPELIELPSQAGFPLARGCPTQ